MSGHAIVGTLTITVLDTPGEQECEPLVSFYFEGNCVSTPKIMNSLIPEGFILNYARKLSFADITAKDIENTNVRDTEKIFEKLLP
jgi:hypothetical protein